VVVIHELWCQQGFAVLCSMANQHSPDLGFYNIKCLVLRTFL
jgi:hypothetical protein